MYCTWSRGIGVYGDVHGQSRAFMVIWACGDARGHRGMWGIHVHRNVNGHM